MHESLLKMFDLAGKSAIVTGVSRGLGTYFAAGLAKAGCDLTISARTLDQLEKVAEELVKYGGGVLPVRADVTVWDDVQKMADAALAEYGKIDILVNNAGIAAVVEAEHMSAEQWNRVMDTNVKGVFLCAQCVGRHMIAQGSGKIINIASMYGISASSFVPQVSYVASKSAVLGLTRELAVEWAPRGLNVVALAPGFFRSDQTVWAFEQDRELGEKLLARVPMGRMGKLDELEGSIVYLASSASDYMNGQALILDGGFLSW
jgi:NAD(P)-dependent dehydrogenase (short-subunit alcohol dehydrogenase family)